MNRNETGTEARLPLQQSIGRARATHMASWIMPRSFRPQSSRDKVREHRERLRAQGLRPIQIGCRMSVHPPFVLRLTVSRSPLLAAPEPVKTRRSSMLFQIGAMNEAWRNLDSGFRRNSSKHVAFLAITPVAQSAVPYGVRPSTFVSRPTRLAAGGGVSAAIRQGRDAVHCLDQMIRRACDADPVNGPATLADWVKTERVHRLVATSVSGAAASTTSTPAALTLSEPVAEAA